MEYDFRPPEPESLITKKTIKKALYGIAAVLVLLFLINLVFNFKKIDNSLGFIVLGAIGWFIFLSSSSNKSSSNASGYGSWQETGYRTSAGESASFMAFSERPGGLADHQTWIDPNTGNMLIKSGPNFVNPNSGELLIKSGDSYVKTNSGEYLIRSGDNYIDSSNGNVYVRSGNSYINTGSGESMFGSGGSSF